MVHVQGYPERLATGEASPWRENDDVRARLAAASQGALRDLAPGPPPVSNEAVLERLLRAAGTSTATGSRPGTAAPPQRPAPAPDARGRGARRPDDMAPLLRAAQDSLRRAAAAAEADVAGQGRELAQDLSYDGRAWRELFEQRVMNSARQSQGAPPARSAPASPRRQRQRESSIGGGGNLDVVSGALATLRQLADRSPSPAPRRKEDSRRGRADERRRDQQQRGQQPRRDGSSRGGRAKGGGDNTRRGASSSVPPPRSRDGPLGAMSSALDSFRAAAGNTLRDLTPGRRRPADDGRASRDDVAPAAPGAPVLGGFVSLSFAPGTRQPMHVLLGGGAMGGVGAHAAAPIPGPWQPGWTPTSRSGVSTPASSYAGGITPAGGSTPPDTPRSTASVTSVASSGLRAWAQGAGHALSTGLGATLLRAAAGGVSASISRVTSRAGSAASTPGGGATPQVTSPQRAAASRDSMAASMAAMPRLRLSGTTDDESAANSARTSGSNAGAAAAAGRNSRREQLAASMQQPQSREQAAALAAAASARARAEAAAAAEIERLSRHAAELARRLEEVERSGEAATQAAARKAVASGVAWHGDDDDPDDVALSQRLATVGAGQDLSPEEQLRLQAVITIQAAFWAWQARKLDGARRVSAATVIQAWWRGHRARTAYETMREPVVAAIIIQCCWRGYIARKAVAARTAAATRIQAAVRGHLARKALFHRLEVEDAAAVAIQAVWRGYATRRVESVRRMTVISAVVCIQAAWMQFKARHLRDARDYISACIIQTAWRGFAARRAYVIHRWISAEAARTIQAHWRRYTARREAALVSARRTAAALRIQAAWLGHLEKQLRVQRNDLAAVTIQRIWRGASTRASVTAETDRIVAATLIAAAWRGATARRTAAELRARAMGRAVGTSDYAARPRQQHSVGAASPALAASARRAQAAVVIQSSWRGTMAREQATYVRHARDAATVAHGEEVPVSPTRSAVDVKQAALEEVRARAAASAARAAALRLDIDIPPAGSPAAPTSPTSPRGRPPLPPAGNGAVPAAPLGSAVRRSFTVAEAQRSFGTAVARSAHHSVASSPGAYVAPAQPEADSRSGSALAALSRIRAAAEATASAHAAQRTAAAASRVRVKK